MIAATPVRRPDNHGHRAVTLCAGAVAAMAALGCQAQRPEAAIAWELAHTVQIDPALIWRLRLTDGRSVPAEFCEPLCDEFDFVQVHTSGQWRRLRQSLRIPDSGSARSLRFSQGKVVGLLARVGEPANGSWPIEFDQVRLVEHDGWVAFRFAPGLYYQLQSAPFFIAAYVPGLGQARAIQVDRRIFVITDKASASPVTPLQEEHITTLRFRNSPC